MQTLNTYLAVANVGASMDFLEHAFGFEQGVILPDADGQIRYAEMRHGTSVVMLIRKGDTTAATSGVSAIYTPWTTWIARWNTHDKPAPESRRLTTSLGRSAASPIPTAIAGCWRRSRSSRRLCEGV